MIVDVANGCLTPFMLLSPARGRGWVRGLRQLLQPPHLTSPPCGGGEYEGGGGGRGGRSARSMTAAVFLRRWFWSWLFGLPLLALAVWGIVDNERLFFATTLNGLTLAALYFLVASGFTLVFGLLRNVNLAHGSLYLLGAYVGWEVGEWLDSWFLAVAAGFLFAALMGLALQLGGFRFMPG